MCISSVEKITQQQSVTDRETLNLNIFADSTHLRMLMLTDGIFNTKGSVFTADRQFTEVVEKR